ncbi:ent-kaurene synthase, chloroplastic-like isoform X4 [Tripterygium wilfordii]|uniref:ent-kaurene synthase, chloroplastic-like isoform X4 n=1 Tax=Tripterygium wilfordii TaxID=458696 RepID=UPI0018F83DE1|nr:ent-kaurene synthase, chloroplastic-like isoform X4 [Tripterygium wilfordii]
MTMMSLSHPNCSRHSSLPISALPKSKSELLTETDATILCFQETKERIKKMFDKTELSVSAYDTAWVAMVSSPNSRQAPCFPECVNWLLDNQLSDGSWGLPPHHPLLVKDALSSTLACLLALKRWGLGEQQMTKGLQFIESNFTSINDEEQHAPIGFNIIFPGMIETAMDMNLNLPLRWEDINVMLHNRDLELRRNNFEGREAYLAYVSEGMGKLQDWEMVMKYQRKNGSLFNSPSTTAAALSHLGNAGCYHYIHSLVAKFGNAVPTVYPSDKYALLCMIGSLERLGIDRHFSKEIRDVLEETYRCWLQGDEEIFSDADTCAMAFRILRVHGYEVSSDPLTQYAEHHFSHSFGGHLKDFGTALELFKASQFVIFPEESGLEKQMSWTNQFLTQEFSNGTTRADRFSKYFSIEVHDTLKFPFHANVERLAHRRNIEHHHVDNTRIFKTSYCFSNISNADFLQLAVEDFNSCQSIHHEELKHLERWVVESRLDRLKFARQKMAYCYFSAAGTSFSPELSDARISWAKNSVLTTVVDDFFDIGGSEEELANLVHLLEKWDANGSPHYCSEQVEIIFSALRNTICEIRDKALAWQGRSVTHHVIEIWLDLLKSMLREAEWARNKVVPTLDEYVENGYVSMALGPIVLPVVYLIGPKVSEEVVRSPEFHNLFKLMSTCGRLINDTRTFKREYEDGKLNFVLLHMIHSGSGTTEEEAVEKIRGLIADGRRELLRLVLQEKDSVVPRACKDLFWKMVQVLHLFYMDGDGFSSPNMMLNAVNDLIREPISL